MWTPIEVERRFHGSCHRFRPVTTAGGIQRLERFLDLFHLVVKAKVLDNVRVVLWWMVAVRDETDAQRSWSTELFGANDVLADGLDVLVAELM